MDSSDSEDEDSKPSSKKESKVMSREAPRRPQKAKVASTSQVDRFEDNLKRCQSMAKEKKCHVPTKDGVWSPEIISFYHRAKKKYEEFETFVSAGDLSCDDWDAQVGKAGHTSAHMIQFGEIISKYPRGSEKKKTSKSSYRSHRFSTNASYTVPAAARTAFAPLAAKNASNGNMLRGLVKFANHRRAQALTNQNTNGFNYWRHAQSLYQVAKHISATDKSILQISDLDNFRGIGKITTEDFNHYFKFKEFPSPTT